MERTFAAYDRSQLFRLPPGLHERPRKNHTTCSFPDPAHGLNLSTIAPLGHSHARVLAGNTTEKFLTMRGSPPILWLREPISPDTLEGR